MSADHVQQVFAMSHVCRAAREGVRGVGGLPAIRISGVREDLLEVRASESGHHQDCSAGRS